MGDTTETNKKVLSGEFFFRCGSTTNAYTIQKTHYMRYKVLPRYCHIHIPTLITLPRSHCMCGVIIIRMPHCGIFSWSAFGSRKCVHFESTACNWCHLLLGGLVHYENSTCNVNWFLYLSGNSGLFKFSILVKQNATQQLFFSLELLTFISCRLCE